MKKIFRVVALCVVIGCTGSVMGAGAEHCMQQDAGRYVAPSDAGGSAKASPTQAAMWAAPAPEEDSGLSWQQVMGIVMLCGACGGGGMLWQKARQVKIEPQPLEVKTHPDFVTKHEFDAYKEEVRDNFKGVHARINTTATTLAEMQGKLDMIAANQDKILKLLLHSHDNK